MAAEHESELDPASVEGIKFLKRAFGMLERLEPAGCERDRAGNRHLRYSEYASLILLGLFNPTLQSLRGLSQVSELRKVQKAIGGPRASLGSLSESVRVFDPQLLVPIIEELIAEVPRQVRGGAAAGIPEELARKLTAVDGSALRALPQIVAAAGGGGQSKWRMHLQFQVLTQAAVQATVTEDEVGGEADERSVLARHLLSERVYLLDRGYERYALLEQIVQARSDYVCRVQQRPAKVLEECPLGETAREAGVLSDEIIQLGRSRNEVGSITHRVRRLVIDGGVPQSPSRPGHERSSRIVLLTNRTDVPAEIIAAIYRLRWSIELFFRFFKHVLGCRQLLSHKSEGVAIQVYCALIAALLMSLVAGRSVGRRGFELFCLYFQGWAEEDEVLAGLKRLADSKKKKKK